MSEPKAEPLPCIFVAIVQYDNNAKDLGVVEKQGAFMHVRWFDGAVDPVTRDARGWLWHEFGARLPIVSRSKREGAKMLEVFGG